MSGCDDRGADVPFDLILSLSKDEVAARQESSILRQAQDEDFRDAAWDQLHA
jgi:hypothetical protein